MKKAKLFQSNILRLNWDKILKIISLINTMDFKHVTVKYLGILVDTKLTTILNNIICSLKNIKSTTSREIIKLAYCGQFLSVNSKGAKI